MALRSIGGEDALTWAQYGEAVEQAAGALANLGVAQGDRVALLSRNRPELAIADVAALHLGAATVALYPASPPLAIEHALQETMPSVLLVESVLERTLPTSTKHTGMRVISIDGHGALASLKTPQDFEFERTWRRVAEDDLATVLYTSGTTSAAKGVEHTHQSALGWARDFDAASPERDHVRDLSFAPFANAAERAAGHWRSLLAGSTRTFCIEPTLVGAALADARPTFLFGSPRLWQGLLSALDATLSVSERATLAEAVTMFRAARSRGRPEPANPDADLVLSELRSRIGLERLEWAITAGAPCPVGLQERAHALGLPLAELYGMTESGGATVTRTDGSDIGTVGHAMAGWEIRVMQDGEVCVRSPNGFRGYRGTAETGKASIDEDGWIRSGDLGELDAQGRLKLTGRRSDLIIPAHGHNVAPGPIEAELKGACSLIAHACIVGNGRPYLAALIAFDVPERAVDPSAHEAVAEAIALVNSARDPRERIEAHIVLRDPWEPGEELTETLKLRRATIATKFAREMDSLY